MSHGDYKAFFAAACAGDVELVRHHLDAGVDVDFVHPELQSTALVAAIEEGVRRSRCSSSTAVPPRPSGHRWRP